MSDVTIVERIVEWRVCRACGRRYPDLVRMTADGRADPNDPGVGHRICPERQP